MAMDRQKAELIRAQVNNSFSAILRRPRASPMPLHGRQRVREAVRDRCAAAGLDTSAWIDRLDGKHPGIARRRHTERGND
jgi:hypothetical protein